MVELSKTFDLTDVLATPEEVARIADISRRVEDLTATKSLDANDSDKIFMLNSATEFTVTLPSIADAGSGWRCKIVVKAAPSGADYVVTEKVANDTNVIITGIAILEIDNTVDGPSNTGHTTISFADGKAKVGDWIDIFCDGTNFYATGLTVLHDGIALA